MDKNDFDPWGRRNGNGWPGRFLFPLFCFVFFSGGAGNASEESVGAVRGVLGRLVERNNGQGGGVVRISDRNGVLWEESAGLVGGPGTSSMTPDTPFEVASVTKAVTAATVLRLVEEGKLGLDSRLEEVLPGPQGKGFDKKITVRQLLSHTSGLPDYWTDGPHDRQGNTAFQRAFLAEPGRTWTPGEILGFARDLPAKRPGGRFHYSDTNYVLLGLIVERAAGGELHDVFRRMIFEPLGMDKTWLTYHEKRRGVEPSHRFEGEEDLHGVPRQSADWAGGGLVSTTRDLEKFLRGIATGALFRNSSSAEAMRESVPVGEPEISYGLGLYRVKLDDGLGELWGHDGHGNSFAYYWPQRGIAFTGTLNQTENDWWPLVGAFVEGEAPEPDLGREGKTFDVSLLAGWDSLYMFRGSNALRDNGGYGDGILWTDLNGTWNLTGQDFLSVDAWNCFSTGEQVYRELNLTFSYRREVGNLALGVEYTFEYGYGSGNFYSHELGATAAYDWEIGALSLSPSLGYYFNLGPDSDTGNGFAKAGSGFFVMRLDGHLPVFRDVVALEPWGAFGVNFQYNTRDGSDGEPVPFNGPNNLECGLAVPVQLNRWLVVSVYGAYSRALVSLTNTAPDTFWGGASVQVSF